MVSLLSETLFPLRQACKHPLLRNTRTNKDSHISTIFRLAMYGGRDIKGNRVKLETVKLPSGLHTSHQAIERFVQRLTDPLAPLPTPKRRLLEIEAAERELADLLNSPTEKRRALR